MNHQKVDMHHAATSRDELVEWVTKKLTPAEHERLREIVERWNARQGRNADGTLEISCGVASGAAPVQLALLRKALDQVVALAAGAGTACADRDVRELCLRAATQCRLVSIHLQHQQLFTPSET